LRFIAGAAKVVMEQVEDGVINKIIDKVIKDLKNEIRKELSYGYNKRWKRGYENLPGVYDVKLNFQQVMIIHKALKKLDKKENKAHLQQKWNTMVKEIHQDYNERMIDKDE
jgi:hypothetical protein